MCKICHEESIFDKEDGRAILCPFCTSKCSINYEKFIKFMIFHDLMIALFFLFYGIIYILAVDELELKVGYI